MGVSTSYNPILGWRMILDLINTGELTVRARLFAVYFSTSIATHQPPKWLTPTELASIPQKRKSVHKNTGKYPGTRPQPSKATVAKILRLRRQRSAFATRQTLCKQGWLVRLLAHAKISPPSSGAQSTCEQLLRQVQHRIDQAAGRQKATDIKAGWPQHTTGRAK